MAYTLLCLAPFSPYYFCEILPCCCMQLQSTHSQCCMIIQDTGRIVTCIQDTGRMVTDQFYYLQRLEYTPLIITNSPLKIFFMSFGRMLVYISGIEKPVLPTRAKGLHLLVLVRLLWYFFKTVYTNLHPHQQYIRVPLQINLFFHCRCFFI